jgi:hypothetical protein
MNIKRRPTITLVTDPFKVEAKLSPLNACGGWDKEFKAAVEVTVNELDDDGFVIEAKTLIQKVRDYFEPATYKASCEQLAQCIINLVHQLMKQQRLSLLAIKVQVFSLTGHIRMEWSKGDEVPELPLCVSGVH